MDVMRVGWKVTALRLNVASVRYRALLPMLALAGEGVTSTVFRLPDVANLEGLDAVVFVKSFSPGDLLLARQAAGRGIAVIIDLCDNIFVPGYGGQAVPAQEEIFLAMAAHARVVVVTTEPLAAEVRARLPDCRVEVVPDGIESPQLAAFGADQFERAEAQERLNRIRARWRHWHEFLALARVRLEEGGWSALPRLGVHALRLLAKAGRWLIKRVLSRLNGILQRARKRVRSRLQVLWENSPATGTVLRFRLVLRAPWAGQATAVDAAAIVPAAEGAPPAEAAPLEPAVAAKRLLWFGNHGAPYARFGMLDLLEIRDALEQIARELPVELVVISDNPGKYEAAIRPLAIPSRYVAWTPAAVEEWMAAADVVLLPNTLDPFSVCKSANRTVLALTRGVPVVATPTPALEPLLPFIEAGDALQGLRRYLSDPDAGVADTQAGSEAARRVFGDAAIARAWRMVLAQSAEPAAEGQPASTAPVRAMQGAR